MPQYFYGTPVGPVFSYSNKMVEVTWAGLKADRDAGILVPGQQYRITNYNLVIDSQSPCGTSVFSSAGHQFDIIVTADSPTVLNENARAALHEGDTYFANCKIESWEIKYCLDNDQARFNWATPSGKGVIYHLKDDRNNQTSYDFKNVKFKQSTINNGNWFYTFGVGDDLSIQFGSNVHNNVILPNYRCDEIEYALAYNLILSGSTYLSHNCRHIVLLVGGGDANYFYPNCSDITIEASSIGCTTFFQDCRNIYFSNISVIRNCTFFQGVHSINMTTCTRVDRLIIQPGCSGIVLNPPDSGTIVYNVEVCSGVHDVSVTLPNNASYKITVANPNDQTILVD